MSTSLANTIFNENKKPDINRLTAIIELIIDQAKKNGASQVEAGASIESGLSVSVRLGETETIEHNRDKALGVTVYFDQRKGSASTTDYSENAIISTVAAACDIARYTSDDEYTGLADKSYMATTIPDLDLYHNWDISTESAIAMAVNCENLARNHDTRITNSEGVSVNSHSGFRIYGNSHGFIGHYPSSRHSISCALIAESNNNMQRDHWYTVARDANDLDDINTIAKKVALRTIARLDSKKVTTAQLPIIFSAEVATSLIGHFLRAINGNLIYRDSSFLLDSIGKKIFPEFITIFESPHILKGLGSAAFDSEGVTTQARDWLIDGVVQEYILDSYSARKLGKNTTGNAGGVRNIKILNKSKNVLNYDELLKKMDRGIVITELMGQGIDMVNGDYSRGAAGYWVENGIVQYPVEEFTIASNLKDMFAGIIAIASDVDLRGNIQSGSILIDSMQVAGN